MTARTAWSDAVRLPAIIKGGWQLAGGHGPVDADAAVRDMFAHAEAGITAFDCADIYTGVEVLIGRFLREWRAAHPSKAGALRVHTKYVPDLAALPHLSFADVERAIDRSRARLGVDALDLVQFHWWDFDVPGFAAAAAYLYRLRERGVVRDVGLTNCDVRHVQILTDAGIRVVSNQVQYSLLDRRPAGAHAATCARADVALLCYGALAGGFLSERWLGAPPPTPPLETRSLVKYRLIIDAFGGWERFQELLGAVAHVARRHQVGMGTVALAWVLAQPQVAAVIAGARNATHIHETLAARTLRLDTEDQQRLADVLARSAGPSGDVYALEREKGGPHAAIMRYDLHASGRSKSA